MKQNTKVVIGISLIAVLILGIAFFQTKQSLIGVGGIPVQEKSFTFDEISGTAESPYFGTIKSNTPAMQEYIDSGMSKYAKHSICGDNDGDVTISNSLSGGGQLTIVTSMTTAKQSCGENYVKTKITIPKGILTATCNSNARETNDGSSVAVCKVGNLFTSSSRWAVECNRGQSNINVAFWEANCKDSNSESKQITITKPTEIEILVTSTTGNSGSASATLTLNFEKEEEEEEEEDSDCETGETPEEVIYEDEITDEEVKEIQCISNMECQNYCGTKVPTCEDGVCFCGGEQIFTEEESTPIYFYLIPVSIFGLVAFIVWMRMKKPKKR